MKTAIIKTRNLSIIHQIGELRYNVWKDENASLQGISIKNKWIEHFDLDAYHFVGISGDKLVAAARLSIHDSVQAVIANGVGVRRRISLEKLGFEFKGAPSKHGSFLKSIPKDLYVMVHTLKQVPCDLNRNEVFYFPEGTGSLVKQTG